MLGDDVLYGVSTLFHLLQRDVPTGLRELIANILDDVVVGSTAGCARTQGDLRDDIIVGSCSVELAGRLRPARGKPVEYDECSAHEDEQESYKESCLMPIDQFALLRGTLSLIHISEPTRLGMISYAVFC